MKLIRLKANKGFTLVELIVAMSVFLIAITITVGTFIQSLKTQRIANHLLSVNSNASLVVERMAREIRTGFDFDLNNVAGGSCTGRQKEELIFTKVRDVSANQVTYKLDGDVIVREECVGTGPSAVCPGFESLTASNVVVSRLCFLETQANPTSPWRITMFLMVGSSNPRLAGNELNLQTTVSARILPEELPS